MKTKPYKLLLYILCLYAATYSYSKAYAFEGSSTYENATEAQIACLNAGNAWADVFAATTTCQTGTNYYQLIAEVDGTSVGQERFYFKLNGISLSQLQSDIDNTTNLAIATSNDLTTAESNISTLQNRADATDTTLGQFNTRISANESTNTAQDQLLVNINGEIVDLNNTDALIQADVSANTTSIGNNTTNITANAQNLQTVQSNLQGNINVNTNSITSNSGEIVELQTFRAASETTLADTAAEMQLANLTLNDIELLLANNNIDAEQRRLLLVALDQKASQSNANELTIINSVNAGNTLVTDTNALISTTNNELAASNVTLGQIKAEQQYTNGYLTDIRANQTALTTAVTQTRDAQNVANDLLANIRDNNSVGDTTTHTLLTSTNNELAAQTAAQAADNAYKNIRLDQIANSANTTSVGQIETRNRLDASNVKLDTANSTLTNIETFQTSLVNNQYETRLELIESNAKLADISTSQSSLVNNQYETRLELIESNAKLAQQNTDQSLTNSKLDQVITNTSQTTDTSGIETRLDSLINNGISATFDNSGVEGRLDTIIGDQTTPYNTLTTASTFGNAYDNFKTAFNNTPVGQTFAAAANIPNQIPTNAACPTIGSDAGGYFASEISTSIHCDIFTTLQGPIGAVILAVWSFIGFRIVVSA